MVIIGETNTSENKRWGQPCFSNKDTVSLPAQDAEGNRVKRYTTKKNNFSSSAGEWKSIVLLEEIPDEIDGVEITQMRLNVVSR